MSTYLVSVSGLTKTHHLLPSAVTDGLLVLQLHKLYSRGHTVGHMNLNLGLEEA